MATMKLLEGWIDLIIVFEVLSGGRFNTEAKESYWDQVREQDGGWGGTGPLDLTLVQALFSAKKDETLIFVSYPT